MIINHTILSDCSLVKIASEAELFKYILLFLYLLNALFGDHALYNVELHEFLIEIAQVERGFDLRLERRRQLFLQEEVSVDTLEEGVTQNFIYVIFLTETVFAVFF